MEVIINYGPEHQLSLMREKGLQILNDFEENYSNKLSFVDFLNTLPKNKWEAAHSYLCFQFREKFKKNKEKKYGSLYKGFSDKEFERFISCENNEKALLCWKFQYLRGFRISEIPSLNIKDINFERKTLKVWTKKAKQWDNIIISGEFEELLTNWINKYHGRIEESKGYIFFSDNVTEKRDHISENWLNKQFRETRTKADLNEIYNKTKPNGKNLTCKPQYILTTHSLRHSAITNFYKKCNDLVLTMLFARHKDFKSTLVYIKKDYDNLREALESGYYEAKYGHEITNKIKEEFKETLKELGIVPGNLVATEKYLANSQNMNLNQYLYN